MAILFTTGTINQPDAGSVGLAMADKLRDDLVVHPAWDLVEEFTPASGAVRWTVFKCLASESGLPADFFVVFGRTLGSGEFRICGCEGYTAATHTMQYFSPGSTSSPYAHDAQGRRPETYILSTVALPGSVITPTYVSWAPSGTSTKYWLAVSEDGFYVAFNGAVNGWLHVGAFTPLTAMEFPMPIVHFGVGTTSGWGGITRNPTCAGISQKGNSLYVSSNQERLGYAGRLDTTDALQGGQKAVSEMGMTLSNPGGETSDAPLYGRFFGKMKRMRMTGLTPPAGIAFGDAFVLNGNLWVPGIPSTSAHIFDTGITA